MVYKMEKKSIHEGQKKEFAVKENYPIIALVRIRGVIRINKEVADTLDMLKLHKKNFCSVQRATPSIIGMVKKVKDYITWGEIDDLTLKQLIEKRGVINPKDRKRTKPFFRLNPPKKGYGRKGIKKTFVQRGALGYRGQKINDLILRML